jgi:hypothetical protein
MPTMTVPAMTVPTTAVAAMPVAAVTGPGVRRSPATAAALAEVAAKLPRTGLPKARGAEVSALTRQGSGTVSTAAQHAPAAKAITKPGTAAKKTAKPRRSPAETLEAAAKIKAADPDITEARLASRLGISASRWRTIRREADQEGLRLAA